MIPNPKKKGTWLSLLFILSGCLLLVMVLALLLEDPQKRQKAKAPFHSDESSSSQATSLMAGSNSSAPEESKKLTIRMVGDNLFHEPVTDSGKQPDGSYQYDHLYAQMKPVIAGADVAIINQETVLGGVEMGLSGYPTFNAPQEVGDALVAAGFDVVQHANNHAMDKGAAGLEKTMAFWQEKYPQIVVVGVNHSAEERQRIRYVEKNGIRLAILSDTESLNGIPLPPEKPWLVDMLLEETVVADIQKAREEGADFVVVLPHWGIEYAYTASSSQSLLAQKMADAGADLIIGTHPHVLEPVKWIKRADGGNTLVYYSLGNFISSQNEPPRMLGGMAEISLKKEGEKTAIVKAGIKPTVTHFEKGNPKAYGAYLLEDYTEELAKKHRLKVDFPEFSLSYLQRLAGQVLGQWYLDPEAVAFLPGGESTNSLGEAAA